MLIPFRSTVGQADLGKLDVSCWETLSRTNTWLEFGNEGVTKGQSMSNLPPAFIVFS